MEIIDLLIAMLLNLLTIPYFSDQVLHFAS